MNQNRRNDVKSRAALLASCGALTAVIWIADYLTIERLSLYIFNLIPIFVVAWLGTRRMAMGFAAMCSVAWLVLLELRLLVRDPQWLVLTEVGLDSSLFFACAWAVSALRRLHDSMARANAELERLNQMKSIFVAMASHDLRSPLSAVTLGAEGMKEELDEGLCDAPALARTSELILAAATRMRVLLDNYLDYGRIETGRMTPSPRPQELTPWAERICRVLRPVAAANHQTLRLECHDDGKPRSFDPDMIEVVLLNLISNALKFSPPGSSVTVAVRAEGEGFRMTVDDEGPGLGVPGEELFELFKRGAAAPQKGQKTTGLGLYIAREAVRAHDGQVRAENRDPRGARFEVTVPGRPQGEPLRSG